MLRCLYLGARSLLICCLAFFVVTTAAPTDTNVGVQPRHQAADNSIEVLDQFHGKTFAFSDTRSKKPYLVSSEVSCFTIQMLHSAEEKEHKVMLWLHYTTLSDKLTHVDTISFVVKPESETTPENKLRFVFEGSSINDLTVKEAEFIHRPNSCYRLKIFKDGGCAFLALLTSSDNSGSDNCLQSNELGTCTSEIYHASESKKCLEYTLVTEEHQSKDTETSALRPINNNPRLETDPALQQYQDFKKGLLFSSLVLVYSSLQRDDFRLCMITYRPNKPPGLDGNLYILTSGLESKRHKDSPGGGCEVTKYCPLTMSR
uniref:Putative salivary lipocalin n=1 Tax=Ixodes ricinus TaxID=34613 RepID=A0A6B0VAA3_IXORI